MRWVLAVVLAELLALGAAAPAGAATRTNATYFNDASLPAADPYVLHDPSTGYYYAYSTDGADPGSYFGIYRSADLVTWEHVKGGALPVERPEAVGQRLVLGAGGLPQPEDRAVLPLLRRAARTPTRRPGSATRTSRSRARSASPCPARRWGRSTTSRPRPIDYNPYDPDYHDVNLLMGPDQKKPPATLEEGEKAPLGTYIPYIDPDVLLRARRRAVPLLLAQRVPQLESGTRTSASTSRSPTSSPCRSRARGGTTRRGARCRRSRLAYRGANASKGGPAARGATAGSRSSATSRTSRRGRTRTSTTTRSAAARRRTAAGRRARRPSSSAAPTTSPTRPTTGSRRATASATPPPPSPLGPFKKVRRQPDPQPEPVDRHVLDRARQPRVLARRQRDVLRPPRAADHRRRPAPPLHRAHDRRASGARHRARHRPVHERSAGAVGVAPVRDDGEPRARCACAPAQTARLPWRVTSAGGASLALANPLNRVSATVANPRVAEVQPDPARRPAQRSSRRPRARPRSRSPTSASCAAGDYFDVVQPRLRRPPAGGDEDFRSEWSGGADKNRAVARLDGNRVASAPPATPRGPHPRRSLDDDRVREPQGPPGSRRGLRRGARPHPAGSRAWSGPSWSPLSTAGSGRRGCCCSPCCGVAWASRRTPASC